LESHYNIEWRNHSNGFALSKTHPWIFAGKTVGPDLAIMFVRLFALAGED